MILSTSDEPELEFSGSSWAELWRFRAEPSWGTLIFELNPSWQNIVYFFYPFFPQVFIIRFCLYIMILINFMIIIYKEIRCFRVKLYELWKLIKDRSSNFGPFFGPFSADFWLVFGRFLLPSWVKKVTSRAEPSWKSFSSSYGSSQLGSDSSLIFTYI